MRDKRNLIKSGIVGGREKMAETKLKPCEVCGSDDLHTRYDPRYPLFIIDCQNCGSRFGYKYPKDKAIEMWNDRGDAE
jgi:hydrogenase maturation factor HypF (carbamoyltransferase family)